MTRVHILLATYNGGAYLQEQLASYVHQTHQDWDLWVSDDNSRDDTRAILEQFRQAQPTREIHILQGPAQGIFANFMSLIHHRALPAGYVALSDQDDVWLPHHLARALDLTQRLNKAAIYCATTIPTDANLQPLTSKPPPPLPDTSFYNAMVQNVVAGNTIVLNPQSVALLRRDTSLPKALPYHDWWLYLRLTAAGAQLICDPRPNLLYRQHGSNSLGHRRSGRLRRLKSLLDGTYKHWVTSNLQALLALAPETLVPEYRQAAKNLLHRPIRLQALRHSKAHRSDSLGRILLPILALSGRL